MSKFTHLHVHSHYSMLDGLADPGDLIQKAKECGMESLALTDHGVLYGAVEFYKKARDADIKPILGMEAYVAPNGRDVKKKSQDGKNYYHLILLAKNNEGWENLIKLATKASLEGFYYKPRIDKELIQEYSDGLVCLSGCMSGEVAKKFENGSDKKAKKVAQWYKDIFGDDYYLEIQPHMPKKVVTKLKNLSDELNIPLVATQDTHYVNKDDQDAHEVLLAVQTGNTIADQSRLSLKEFDLSFKSPEEMRSDFRDVPEALENTAKIADKCNVEIELGKYKIPEFPVPEGETDQSYMEKLIEERLPERFEEKTKEVEERLNMELGIIKKMGFANYFLIVQDIINWAKAHGIVVGPGRGSAAGSLVSYILGITDVDPLKYDLLFERFLNPERIQVPDIDIDFADTRRDEVMAYVREKYGDDHVAQIITFGKMMARAAIRDAGRALGLPYGLCDRIAKLIPFQATIDEALESVDDLKKEYQSSEDVKQLINYSRKLEGAVRHASVHACGVVISPQPLTKHVPLQKAPQGDDSVITQFEMKSVESLGLLKMDFLGLKNLTIIEDALRLIKEHKGDEINISELPLDDHKTFKLLQEGETTGVFQLESSGMRRYLKQLQPTQFEDIDVMIALYRPGPMDLIPHYIKRKHGEEKVTYLHPKLEPILGPTYGVGVYQEQMMKIARDLGNFSLGEADVLRKAIGKKIKSLLDQQKKKLINGMMENGIDGKTAKKIWGLFPPFARYGFNRSHSVSYGMISYQTAYLKANYPVEFMTSLLNTSATDVDRINFLVKEARRLNIEVLPPDINLSLKRFTIDEENEDIRFGLLAIKNLGYNVVDAIIEERMSGGPYKDIADFLSRVHHRDLNKKSLESLIKCGALDSLNISRRKAMGNLEEIVRFNQAARKQSQSNQGDLFGGASNGTLKMPNEEAIIDKQQILAWEKELLGLYLTDHPFSAYESKVKEAEPISEVLDHEQLESGPRYSKVAGVISNIKQITTKKGDPMLFVTLEDQSNNMELLVFSNTLSKSRQIWEEGNAILTSGRLSFRDDEPKLICNKVKQL